MSKAKKLLRLQGADFTFEGLVRSIRGIDAELTVQVRRAVNVSLTYRNWLIGCYIAEYELRGNDRAAYGEKLLASLAAELGRFAVSNSNRRQLYRYLRFYRTYPEIVGTLSPQSRAFLPGGNSAHGRLHHPVCLAVTISYPFCTWIEGPCRFRQNETALTFRPRGLSPMTGSRYD